MSRISDLLDVLKVEVETPTTGLKNLLANPSGDLGAWAWRTDVGLLTSGTDGIANPGFEVNTTGWNTGAAFNVNPGGTLTRDLTQHDSGLASGKVVTTAAAGGLQGIWATATIPANTEVTFSARVKATAGRPVQMRARDTTNGVSNNVTTDTAAVGAGWVTLSVTIVTGAATATVQVSLTADNTAAVSTFYVDSLASSYSGAYLEYQTAAFTQGPLSEDVPVTPGQYVSASWYTITNDALYIRAWVNFYDASGLMFSSSAAMTYSNAQGQRFSLTPALIPAGAVTARLVFQPASTSGGAAPAAGKKFRYRQAVVSTATTAAALGPVYTNKALNPSFENPAHGWTIYNGTGVLAAVAGGISGGNQLRFTNTGAKFGIQSPEVAVTAGVTYSAGAWVSMPATSFSVYLSWYTAAHVLISSALIGNQFGGAVQRPRIDALAPVGAAFARVQVSVTGGTPAYVDAWHIIDAPGVAYFDGATPDVAGSIDYAWSGTPNSSASTKSLSNLPYIPPITYQEIQGSAVSIGLQQRTFDCTLSVSIRDAALDPATANLIRPGRAVRVSVKDTLGTWRTFFQGKANRPSVDYGDLKRRTRPLITLSAYGPGAELVGQARPYGVATIAELPAVLEGVRIPFLVNGLSDQVNGYSIVSSNDQATALDQVILARDSQSGYAWVGRDGILRAYQSRNVDYYQTGYANFVEGDYTGLGLSYDPEQIINQVTVILLRYNPSTGETEEVTYGPYTDEASIREWGPGPAEFRVQGPVNPATFAAAVLAANSTGTQRVENLRVPITDTEDLTPLKALVDLYALATVQNVDRGILVEQRVQGIDHTITWTAKNGPRWYMDLLFQGVDDAATPIQTPPAGAPAITDGTWINVGQAGAPAFSGAWANYDAIGTGYMPTRFMRKDGIVYLQVMAKTGAINTTIFTLPPGYRPAEQIVTVGLSNVDVPMRVNIGTSGNVSFQGQTAGFAYAGCVVSFPAEA